MPEAVQEGSRWIGPKPTGAEVAKWFEDNVRLHEGLHHADYVQGITLISGQEKQKVVNQQGAIVDVQRLVHTPYAKVDMRIRYFWDVVDRHDDWMATIETVEVPRVEREGVYNEHLPPGFFRHPVQGVDNKHTHFIGISKRVVVYRDVQSVEIKTFGGTAFPKVVGTPVRIYPAATKVVELLSWNKPDTFALMKAETGAVGRALGMAGMLVLPGSGVATAEDMEDVGRQVSESAAPGDLPAEGGDPTFVVRDRIAELSHQLEQDAPGKLEDIRAWAKEKKIDLDELKDMQLRSVLAKLETAVE